MNREADVVVVELRSALREQAASLTDVPLLLRRILKEEMWRERVIRASGEIVTFERFSEFVTTPPLEGLGEDVDTLKRLCADDMETLDLLDAAMQAGQKPGERTDLVSIINDVNDDRPAGTTRTYALRRLRKSRPDLHEQVIAGDLSPHAAMIEAGFRRTPLLLQPLQAWQPA